MSDEILSEAEIKSLFGGITSNKLTKLIKNGLPYIDLRDKRKVFLKSSVIAFLKSKELPKKKLAGTG